MIVTAHQPNFLPGWNVVRKALVSDAVIWLDQVQFTSPGWSNRNKLPDGKWLTVPVEHPTMVPFNTLRIYEKPDWRERAVQRLRLHYAPPKRKPPFPQLKQWMLVDEVCQEILRPYRLLVGLNLAILRVLFESFQYGDDHGPVPWIFQSHLDAGSAISAVGDTPEELLPISDRLAMMVAEIGGTTYLSGPSGRNYLDETPFLERGIKVDYYDHEGQTNDCALGLSP